MLVMKIYENIIIININKYCDNMCYLLIFISVIFYYIFLQHFYNSHINITNITKTICLTNY